MEDDLNLLWMVDDLIFLLFICLFSEDDIGYLFVSLRHPILLQVKDNHILFLLDRRGSHISWKYVDDDLNLVPQATGIALA